MYLIVYYIYTNNFIYKKEWYHIMAKKPLVPVFYAVDDNYAPILFVGIEAIKAQADPERDYHIIVLIEELKQEYKDLLASVSTKNVKVEVYDLSETSKQYAKQFYNRDYYTNTAWFRLFIPEIFTQFDKIVYLDCDTVVNTDVAELFDVDIKDYYAAVATCETCDTFPIFTDYIQKYMGFAMPWYFNSGVLLLNCDLLRKDHFEAKFFDLIKKHHFELIQDQDSMNVLFRGKCKFLPQTWNKIPLPKPGIDDTNVKIVHYNLIFRPWRYDGIDFVGIKLDKIPFEDIFWKHAKNCPTYEKILEDKKNYSDEDRAKDLSMANNIVEKAIKYSTMPREETWAGLEFTRKIEIKKD